MYTNNVLYSLTCTILFVVEDYYICIVQYVGNIIQFFEIRVFLLKN